MKKIIFLFSPLIILSGFMINQNIKVLADKSKSTISYHMSHPMHDWTGVSHDVKSAIICNEKKDTIQQVGVAVKISSFDSDNANRDSHAMEVTEALKYPAIVFKSTSITYENGTSMLVKGNLTWHGVTKEISFVAQQKLEAGTAVVSGKFTVNMTDYNIETPSLLGIDTDEEFAVDFNVYY